MKSQNEKELLFFKFLLNKNDLLIFKNNSSYKTIREIFTSNDFSLDDFIIIESVLRYKTSIREFMKRQRKLVNDLFN